MKKDDEVTTIYLVRHGRAASGWDDSYDPGLNDLGRMQADNTARILAPLGPLVIVSSPLTRARETSLPLTEIWGLAPRIEERVGEIVTPTLDPVARVSWLIEVMKKRWNSLDEGLLRWRKNVIEALCELREDTVVFTHFVAINVAVGEALGDDRVMVFLPDNGSITTLRKRGKTLTLVEKGVEMETPIG